MTILKKQTEQSFRENRLVFDETPGKLRQGSSTERQDSTSERQDSPSGKRDNPSGRKDDPPEKKDSTPKENTSVEPRGPENKLIAERRDLSATALEKAPETKINLNQVVLIGDSIGRGIDKYGFQNLDSTERNILAVGGAQIEAIAKQLDLIDAEKTPYLIIQGGTNNFGHEDPEVAAEKLIKLYELAANKDRKPPFKKVMLVTTTPHKNMPAYDTKDDKGEIHHHPAIDWGDRAIKFNVALTKAAKEKGINLYDLHSACIQSMQDPDPRKRFDIPGDGIHPGGKSYKVIGKLLANAITEGTYTPTEAEPDIDEKKFPPKALHSKHLELAQSIKEEQASKDDETIKGIKIRKLRKFSRILNTSEAKEENDDKKLLNVKDETARRIRAYTSERNKEWYTLNYEKFGSDSDGLSHEMNVGLGDILLDPDIQEILVLRSDGEIIKGKRGIVESGRHKGRVAFLNEKGRYIATHTGDKFRILSDTETKPDDKESVSKFVQTLKTENQARESFDVTFSKTVVEASSGLPFAEITDLDPEKTVSEQIKFKLNESQLKNAKIIEEEFIKAGLTQPNLIAAAIINSFKESGLNASIVGQEKDNEGNLKGVSVGLFQLYDRGTAIRDGKLMSVEERQDPRINTQRIIEVIKSGRGTNLRSQAKAGASVQDLVYTFCYKIEVPSDRITKGRERAKFSLDFWAKKPAELDKLIGRYTSVDSLPANVDLRNGQDTWYIGSSTVYGLSRDVNHDSEGVVGLEGGGTEQVYKELTDIILPRTEKISSPKRVILLGMGINTLSTTKPVEKTVNETLESYLKIAKIFESKGAEVKISPLQLYKGKEEQITAFNKELKTNPKYSKYFIDTGIDAPEIALPDGLHLDPEGTKTLLANVRKNKGNTA